MRLAMGRDRSWLHGLVTDGQEAARRLHGFYFVAFCSLTPPGAPEPSSPLDYAVSLDGMPLSSHAGALV